MIKNAIALFCVLFSINLSAFSQNKKSMHITLTNSIHYTDTSFTDLPGNGFLITFGAETLAVTCKHVLWGNRTKEMKTVSFGSKLLEWRMIIKNDPTQYVILGDLINENTSEIIGERNTDNDYLVFKIKENHSTINPLKISPKHAETGDTLSIYGWGFKTKKLDVQLRQAIANKYSGYSLLITNLIQDNYVGTSGSPVINKNGELVAIVSSWKYDMEHQNYYEANCSVDYLWEVLYLYWLKNNNKIKSFDTFKEFTAYYESANNCKLEVSSFLCTKLFFNDWLQLNKIKYGKLDNYDQWTKSVAKAYGINIGSDSYQQSLLIFNNWLENYIAGKMDCYQLEPMLEKAGVFFPDLIDFCEQAIKLSEAGLHSKAIDLLQFADDKIPNSGQVNAFLGEVYRAKGDKIAAKQAYLKCLETYPEYPLALEGLSKL